MIGGIPLEKEMDDLLSNEAQTNSVNVKFDEAIDGGEKEQLQLNYCHTVFSGKAFTERELMHMSSRYEVKLILVAGPHESGKTTLLTMFYQMFLIGVNKNINFAGSNTMLGFWERRKDLLLNSGRTTPKVARTFLEANDNFLHLNIMDNEGNKKNLIFSDISGEGFEDDGKMSDFKEIFESVSTILLILDGAEIADLYKRRNVINRSIRMFGSLVKYHIACDNTNVMVICTKFDYIDSLPEEEKKSCMDFILENINKIQNSFQSYVSRIEFGVVSLQQLGVFENLEETCAIKSVESVLEFCMKSEEVCELTYSTQGERGGVRHFEKYGLFEDERNGE